MNTPEQNTSKPIDDTRRSPETEISTTGLDPKWDAWGKSQASRTNNSFTYSILDRVTDHIAHIAGPTSNKNTFRGTKTYKDFLNTFMPSLGGLVVGAPVSIFLITQNMKHGTTDYAGNIHYLNPVSIAFPVLFSLVAVVSLFVVVVSPICLLTDYWKFRKEQRKKDISATTPTK